MSLLERIKAHPLPLAELLGVEFVSAAPDAVEARMVVRPALWTLGQFAHGGAVMSFADTLGGAAAFASLPAEAKGTTTLDSKTNFIAGAPGSTLIGRCALIHRGRRTQVWETRVDRGANIDRANVADPDDALIPAANGGQGNATSGGAEMFASTLFARFLPAIARNAPAFPARRSRRVVMSLPRPQALRSFCRIDLQSPDVERRVLPTMDGLLISLRRRLEEAAPEPEFQDQVVDGLETIRDRETHIVNVALRHGDGPEFGLSCFALPYGWLEMALDAAGRVGKEETVDHVVAGVANGIEQGAGLCALIPNLAIVPRLELPLQKIHEKHHQRHVSHAGDHHLANVLRPPCRGPDQGREFSFQRIPGEVDEADAGQVLVVETGPLAPRQGRIFEHLTHLKIPPGASSTDSSTPERNNGPLAIAVGTDKTLSKPSMKGRGQAEAGVNRPTALGSD